MFNSLRQSLARTIWPEVFEQARQSAEKDARIAELMSELRETEELCGELDDKNAEVVERLYKAIDVLNGKAQVQNDDSDEPFHATIGSGSVATGTWSVRNT